MAVSTIIPAQKRATQSEETAVSSNNGSPSYSAERGRNTRDVVGARILRRTQNQEVRHWASRETSWLMTCFRQEFAMTRRDILITNID